MAKAEKPFHEKEYKETDGIPCPILKVLIGKNKKPISAYADTGCISGISMLKEQIKGIDMGERINDEPSPCVLADGRIIGSDEYLTTVTINGEERQVVVSIVDPSKELGFVPLKETTPLLGRDFLDAYNVLFKGKEQKIALFRC